MLALLNSQLEICLLTFFASLGVPSSDPQLHAPREKI